jgi:thiamine-phosphate pyrophosphorylase
MPGGDVLRILDANFNRAREALRVLEDAARLGLGDGELAGACKRARDELRVAAGELGVDAARLAAARDTPGDVGTGLSTPGEADRAGGVHGVVVAAGKRLSEALRTIEEFGKTLGGGEAGGEPGVARIKRLRYEGYELERRLTLATAGGRARQWRLCVLITESLCTHHPWERIAEEAIAGGADCLQLREKTLDGGELVKRARRLVEIARSAPRAGVGGGGAGEPASVIVNDRVDVALAAGADGVHVGQTDLSVADVRRVAGTRLLVGVSTANMEQALRAVGDGADSCGCGPMFATTTKHKPVLSGPAYLRAYLADERTARVPHLAIAGITPGNVGELRAAGARGIAVSSVVCGASDPRGVCEVLVGGIGG